MTAPSPTSPALAAYAKAAERIAPKEDDAPVQSFGSMLEQTLTEAVDANREGEAAAIQAAGGRAGGLQDVIEAVNAAELTLETVVAVRDRVIAAYQEIMRMPI